MFCVIILDLMQNFVLIVILLNYSVRVLGNSTNYRQVEAFERALIGLEHACGGRESTT